MNVNAAESLVGQFLNNRWLVESKIDQPPNSTGGFFSVCYIVNDGETKAFLKALNFLAFFQLFRGKPFLDILQEQTNAFQYEKQLLHRCKNKRLSKVSIILDEGEVYLDGYIYPSAPYLIFEMANGDIRSQINFTANLNYAWKLRSLHNVAIGLMQLHSIYIGHQDLKPSNVLLYKTESNNTTVCKIADLGRSLCNDIDAPHDDGNFPGDFTYAPPEYLYNEQVTNWSTRIKSTDIYLFGSLIVFYFSGLNMNSFIIKHLPAKFHPRVWTGNYTNVLPYVINAFSEAMIEFRLCLGDTGISDDIVNIVKYCCNPVYEKRGIRNSINSANNSFDFMRIASMLDLYARKAEIKLL